MQENTIKLLISEEIRDRLLAWDPSPHNLESRALNNLEELEKISPSSELWGKLGKDDLNGFVAYYRIHIQNKEKKYVAHECSKYNKIIVGAPNIVGIQSKVNPRLKYLCANPECKETISNYEVWLGDGLDDSEPPLAKI